MVDECRSYGMEIMVSVWPFTCPGSRSYDTLVNNTWITTYIGDDPPPNHFIVSLIRGYCDNK